MTQKDSPGHSPRSALASWTPEQVAAGRKWVQTWQRAGVMLERIRRDELRQVDSRAVAHLCGPADYRVPPRAPKPYTGLIEQQQWFVKLRGVD
jgi:hypothetical protein